MKKLSKQLLNDFLARLDLDEDDELDLTDLDDLAYVFELFSKATYKRTPSKPKQKPSRKPSRKPSPEPEPELPQLTYGHPDEDEFPTEETEPPPRELVEVDIFDAVEAPTDKSEVRGGDALEPRTSDLRLEDGEQIAPQVYYVESGSLVAWLENNEELNDDRVMVAGHLNKKLTDFTTAFDEAYKAKMQAHTPFEDVDDLPIGRFGVLFRTSKAMDLRNDSIEAMKSAAIAISKLLPDGYAAHIVDEGKNFSIRIGLGIYNDITFWSDGKREMAYQQSMLESIAEVLMYITSRNPIWFPFWEWPREWVRPS